MYLLTTSFTLIQVNGQWVILESLRVPTQQNEKKNTKIKTF
jgi:hypothetical protein